MMFFWGAQSVFNATGQDSLVKDSLPASLQYFDGKSDVFKIEQSGGRFLHANIEYVKDFREILLGTTAQFIAAQRFYEKNKFDNLEKHELPPEFPIMSVDVKFYKRVLL